VYETNPPMYCTWEPIVTDDDNNGKQTTYFKSFLLPEIAYLAISTIANFGQTLSDTFDVRDVVVVVITATGACNCVGGTINAS
jgi:hypothetical protein